MSVSTFGPIRTSVWAVSRSEGTVRYVLLDQLSESGAGTTLAVLVMLMTSGVLSPLWKMPSKS